MRKFTLVFSALLLASFTLANCQDYSSSIFDWDKLPVKKTASGEVREIYNGPTLSLEKFVIKAVTLNTGKSFKSYPVEKGSDELIIVREGSLDISINNKKLAIEEGDIVVAYQGDVVVIGNSKNQKATFFSFLFDPKGKDQTSQVKSGSDPVYRDWSALEFKTNSLGGRRDLLKQPTAVLRELEIHATTLNGGLSSHAGHIHHDEEIILMRFGTVDGTFGDKTQTIGPGSMMFATNDDMHGVSHAGSPYCEYYAFRWLVNE